MQDQKVSYTPGPWTVDDNTQTAEVAKAAYLGEKWAQLLMEQGPYRIESRSVTVCGDVSGIGSQAEANARLIAAAPDLLEAAKRLIAEGDEYTFRDRRNDMRDDPLIEELQAAIDKAEGR